MKKSRSILGDKFFQFIVRMLESEDYLKIENLKDCYSYKIFARNACVGIWVKNKNAFLISRYKMGPNPYFAHEYHWDIGEPFGTVKPLELIEKCPFESAAYDPCTHVPVKDYKDEQKEMLKYLDKLEEDHPIIPGYDSLKSRKESAIKFERRLAGQHDTKRKAGGKLPIPVWRILLNEKDSKT